MSNTELQTIADSTTTIDVHDGQILIVRCEAVSQEEVQQFAKCIENMGKQNVMVIFLTGDETIEAANEQQMNQYGWYRQTPAAGNTTLIN